MSAPIRVRCSSLPRLLRCPASQVTSEGQPSPASEASALGTAFHEIFAAVMEVRDPEIAKTAARYGVDEGLLEQWKRTIPTAAFDGLRQCEVPFAREMGGGELSGTADLVLRDGDRYEIADVKTGNPDFSEEDQWLQLAGYAIGLAPEDATTVTLSLWYCRLGAEGWKHREINLVEAREQVEAIVASVVSQYALESAKRRYRTGEHCHWCPGRAVCPARTTELRIFAAITEGDGMLPIVTVANAPALLARAKAIQRVVDAVKSDVKDLVREQGGEIDAGDGKCLQLTTVRKAAYQVKESTVETLRVVKR